MIDTQNIQIDQRVRNAVSHFEQGYNCAQSVLLAYADLYDLDAKTALKIASSFGGGMGRLREVCGAVSGMFMVLGLHYPIDNVKDRNAKTTNYQAVQRTAKAFSQEMGSYICADLLHLKRQPEDATPSTRTATYYASRPCLRCVSTAARIVGEEIAGRGK